MDLTPAIIISIATVVVTLGASWGGMKVMINTVSGSMDRLSLEVQKLALSHAEAAGQKEAIALLQAQMLDMAVRLARIEPR
jgi:hypothetical protein